MINNANKAQIAQLREGFEVAFPAYAARLNKVQTEQEFHRVYGEIYAEVLEQAKPFLSAEEIASGCPAMALTPGQYASMIMATGEDIQAQVSAILKTAQVIQKDWDAEQAAAQFILGGLTGITKKGIESFGKGIEADLEMAKAVLQGISEAGVPGIVAAIAVSVVAIIIPIIYFALKPASCFALVLNETDGDLEWVDDYNVHGKPVINTSHIPASISFGDDRYVACGIVQTDKKDGALIGTQYGFTYSSDDGDVSFGMECPLTSIFVDNNCYCAIGSDSKSVAEKTDEKNLLDHADSKDGLNLNISIACNSPSGYKAFYIARVEDGSLASL